MRDFAFLMYAKLWDVNTFQYWLLPFVSTLKLGGILIIWKILASIQYLYLVYILLRKFDVSIAEQSRKTITTDSPFSLEVFVCENKESRDLCISLVCPHFSVCM